MRGPLAGTVTFLFTDLEGSTRLLERLGERYAILLTDFRRILRTSIGHHHGQEIDTQGDALFVVFPRASDALAAAIAAQVELAGHAWPDQLEVRARVGLHTGEPLATDTGYVGMDVHRAARICQAGHGGQILLSQTTRDLVAGSLPDRVHLKDLGAYRLKDMPEAQHLFQTVATGLPTEFPAPRAPGVIAHNLPRQLTSFVGRAQEMADIRRLLQTTPLLTLTGAGGCGKTRLAIETAFSLADQFVDGVWLVELAPLSDPALVPQAVAVPLGVREQTGRPMLQVLIDHLRAERLLLVLDNCERLVPACGRLADALLRACPDVRILTTSRQPLGVEGETTYEVTPLDLPDPHHLPPLHQLSAVSAIKLFADRAMASLPSFAITETNVNAVVHTCQRLDGIPLALELAAARIKAISVEQLAQRLDDSFRLLTGGGPTKLPHHQTLQAMMDWSYDLLTDRERRLFRWLSVFAGGFTLDAAEQVCAGPGQARREVLDLLSNLVDKSLVAVGERDRDLRYRLLEPVRMYAEDKLREAEEHTMMRGRHLEYFAAFAERVETTLWTGEHKRNAALLDIEHGNLRAGLEWARSGEGTVEAGLRVAAALGWFWYVRGYSPEARRWLEDLVPRRGAAASRVQVRALNRAGLFAWHQGNYDHAVMRCNEGLALARQLEDKAEVAFALSILGMIASQPQGAYDRATRLLSESLELAQEMGDRWTTAMDLHHLGRVSWRRGEYARAQELLEHSLSVFRGIDDDTGIAYAKYSLGLVARDQGDTARAVALQEESLALMVETGDRIHYAVALNSLGILARLAGDYVKAVALADESLRQFQEYGDKPGVGLALYSLGMAIMYQGGYRKAGELLRQSLAARVDVDDRRAVAEVLEGLAALAALDRQPERGARLLGMAQALREAVGAPVPAALRQEYERTISALRAALGTERFEAVVLEGQSATLKQAVSFAAQETRFEPEV